MILVDSHGWIEYFGEGPLADDYSAFIEKTDEEGTVTPTIVIYEVYKKIKSVRGEEKALEAYVHMLRTRIVDLTDSLYMEAADISMNLDLGMADSIIAATAKAYNAQIVTCDKHLRNVENVNFISR